MMLSFADPLFLVSSVRDEVRRRVLTFLVSHWFVDVQDTVETSSPPRRQHASICSQQCLVDDLKPRLHHLTVSLTHDVIEIGTTRIRVT